MTVYRFLTLIFICFIISSTPLTAQTSGDDIAISLEKALELAPQNNKKILVDVYATWCPYCQRMHGNVYPSEEVQQAIEEYFYLVKIDIEGENTINYLGEEMTEAEFALALQNESVPTTYFLNGEGAIIGVQPGFLEIDVFSSLLNFVGSDAFRTQSFNEYSNNQ